MAKCILHLNVGTGYACAGQNMAKSRPCMRSFHERRMSCESNVGALPPTGSKLSELKTLLLFI